jgi:hypothetical protein
MRSSGKQAIAGGTPNAPLRLGDEQLMGATRGQTRAENGICKEIDDGDEDSSNRVFEASSLPIRTEVAQAAVSVAVLRHRHSALTRLPGQPRIPKDACPTFPLTCIPTDSCRPTLTCRPSCVNHIPNPESILRKTKPSPSRRNGGHSGALHVPGRPPRR